MQNKFNFALILLITLSIAGYLDRHTPFLIAIQNSHIDLANPTKITPFLKKYLFFYKQS